MNLNEVFRTFRTKVRDTEDMKAIYRKFRQLRDDLIKETTEQATDFLDWFESLPLDKQLEILEKLYNLIFGEKNE